MNARRARKGHGGGGGRGRSRGSSVRPSTAPPEVNHSKVDLNSRSATTVANITFLPVHQHTFPIIHFDCYDSLRTCQQIREWLDVEETEEIRTLIRFDDQELNLIGTEKKGKVILLEGAAALDNNPLAPITVLALLIPKEDRIRFFWSLLSPSPLLTDLTAANLLGPPRTFSSGPLRYSANGNLLPPRHHTMYTILTQNFHSATTYPDSPDFKAASLISDLCPAIKDPAHAARRVEANDELHTGNNPMNDGKDLFDDRYILELPPAERALACLVFAGCAEYLLIKRIYFKAFARELVLNASKVRRAAALQRGKTLTGKQNRIANNQDQDGDDDGDDKKVKHEDVKDEDVKPEGLRADTPNATSMALRSRAGADLASLPTHDPAHMTNAQIGTLNRELRVRTKNRHIRALRAQTEWNFARARKMVIGWEMLGFLEEKRVLDVVDGRENNEGEEYGDDGDDEDEDDESVMSEVTLA